MKIKEFSQQTSLPIKTIRYYEEIGILPAPRRSQNKYRDYDEQAVDRAKFVAGARALDLSLDEIAEILAMRDRREAPCRMMLNSIEQKANQIGEKIKFLRKMEMDLKKLYELGLTFPTDDVDGKNCVCHLVSKQASSIVKSRSRHA